MITPYILLFVGFILLAKGADIFIDGASNLARYFNVSSLFIGLTLAAFGTSAPEAAVSLKATITGINGIALGNVVGSNIANIALAIGIVALIKPLHVEDSTIKKEMPIMLVSTLLLLLFTLNISAFPVGTSTLTRWEGCVFLILLFGFVVYLWKMAQKDRRNPLHINKDKKVSLPKNIFMILIGGGAIALGSHFAVDNAEKIARMWNVSEKIIGISVVALGTSIPEIVTAIVAVVKGEISIAVGNIVGSNIFNILLVLGVASAVNPISLPSEVIIDVIVCLFIAIIFFLTSKFSKKIYRKSGAFFILFYIVYIITLFMRK